LNDSSPHSGLLDAVATRVGFPARAVNLHGFRHSYCAAR